MLHNIKNGDCNHGVCVTYQSKKKTGIAKYERQKAIIRILGRQQWYKF